MVIKRKYKKEDFDLSLLPGTRKDQFFTFLKNEKLTLLKIGAVLFMFLIPMIVLGYVEGYYKNYVYDLVNKGTYTQAAGNYSIFITDMIFSAIRVACLVVFSIGLSGIAKIIKNLAWNQGVLFVSDFLRGIMENCKSYAITSFIYGIVLFILKLLNDFGVMTGYFYVSIFFYITLFIYVILFVPIALFNYSQSAVYKNGFFSTVSNSASLCFSKYLISLCFALPFAAIYFVSIIYSSVFYFVIIFIVSLIFLPWYILAFYLFSLSLFDEKINIDMPEYYRKGLYSFSASKANDNMLN